MNKIIVTLICAMMSLTMAAQPAPKKPRMDKRQNADMVVNMQVIRHMGLDSLTVNAVRDLKKQKAQAMKESWGKAFKGDAAGQKEMSREERQAQHKARMEQMGQFAKDYRKELRKILGDEKYIEYLEKLNAAQRMQRPMSKMQRPMQPRGQQNGPDGKRPSRRKSS